MNKEESVLPVLTPSKHKRRSLKELDNVIDEIIDRNPIFVSQLEKFIEEKLKEQDAISSRSRSS